MGRKVFIGRKTISEINTGGLSVGTSVVQLSNNGRQLQTGVEIVADADNSGIVYVGVRSNLTAGSDNHTDGFPLSPRDSILLPVESEDDVYLIADTASQVAHFVSS